MPSVRPIDANAIIEKLQSYYESLSPVVYSEFIRRDEVSSCIAELINAPTIDVQPMKRGHWSECWRDPERNVISVICSACENASLAHLPEKDLPVEDVPKKICILMPYCPKCSAKMCGGDEDDNKST